MCKLKYCFKHENWNHFSQQKNWIKPDQISPPSWRGNWLATPWTSSSSRRSNGWVMSFDYMYRMKINIHCTPWTLSSLRRSNGWAAGSLWTNIHTTHSKIGCHLKDKFDHIPPRFLRYKLQKTCELQQHLFLVHKKEYHHCAATITICTNCVS